MTISKRRNSTLATAILFFRYHPMFCQALLPLTPITKPSFRNRGSNLFRRMSSSSKAGEDLDVLRLENSVLRETIRQLEEDNESLRQNNQIVLENFEGESLFRERDTPSSPTSSSGTTLSGEALSRDGMWCDELEDGRNLIIMTLECCCPRCGTHALFFVAFSTNYPHITCYCCHSFQCRSMPRRTCGFLSGCPSRSRFMASRTTSDAILFGHYFEQERSAPRGPSRHYILFDHAGGCWR